MTLLNLSEDSETVFPWTADTRGADAWASSCVFSAFFRGMRNGSFGDGFEVVGPFKTEGLALEWVEDNFGDDWWIVPLVSGNVERKDNG